MVFKPYSLTGQWSCFVGIGHFSWAMVIFRGQWSFLRGQWSFLCGQWSFFVGKLPPSPPPPPPRPSRPDPHFLVVPPCPVWGAAIGKGKTQETQDGSLRISSRMTAPVLEALKPLKRLKRLLMASILVAPKPKNSCKFKNLCVTCSCFWFRGHQNMKLHVRM